MLLIVDKHTIFCKLLPTSVHIVRLDSLLFYDLASNLAKHVASQPSLFFISMLINILCCSESSLSSEVDDFVCGQEVHFLHHVVHISILTDQQRIH